MVKIFENILEATVAEISITMAFLPGRNMEYDFWLFSLREP
jgi:hypothetical protein